jgi:hypothetical protein
MTWRELTLGPAIALAFNTALFALPFAAAASWQALQRGEVYAYALTEPSQAATRTALEQAAQSLLPENVGRTEAWRQMFAREIADNDFRAAHGVLLSAPALLAPADANRLLTQLPPNASDDQIANSAIALLPEEMRMAYQAPLTTHDIDLLGDVYNLRESASQWLAREKSADDFMLRLTGFALARADEENPGMGVRVRTGASVIRIAARTGRLKGPFMEALRRRLDAAVPLEATRQRLSAALAQNDEALLAIFDGAANPREADQLAQNLAYIQAIARGADPAVAATLLELAVSEADLPRLALVAAAGRDRATLIAKRGTRDQLLGAAKGAASLSASAWAAFAGLGACVFGLIAATLVALSQAVTGEWRGGRREDLFAEESE